MEYEQTVARNVHQHSCQSRHVQGFCTGNADQERAQGKEREGKQQSPDSPVQIINHGMIDFRRSNQPTKNNRRKQFGEQTQKDSKSRQEKQSLKECFSCFE